MQRTELRVPESPSPNMSTVIRSRPREVVAIARKPCYFVAMARVESLQIEGFRGIKQGRLEDLADVNILVGRNNSGKTTVAEALSRSLHTPNPDVTNRYTADIWEAARGGAGTQVQHVPQKGKLRLEATVRVGELRFACDQSGSTGGPLEGAQGTEEAFHELNEFRRWHAVFRPADAGNTQIEKALWNRLLAERKDKQLITALREIFDVEAEQIQLLPEGRLILVLPDYSLPLDAHGDGTRAALRCLMLLAAVQDTLFIIEEPEAHQHPGSLESFARALCGRGRAQRVQLVLSTHSVDCVRSFIDAVDRLNQRAKPDPETATKTVEAAVYHLKLEAGLLDARRLEADRVKTLLETGTDVRFLDLYV